MSTTEPNQRVKVTTPRGRRTVGLVVSRLATGDVGSGPTDLLVVDVAGSRYRVPEDEAELL